jgi:hypothetical protein
MCSAGAGLVVHLELVLEQLLGSCADIAPEHQHPHSGICLSQHLSAPTAHQSIFNQSRSNHQTKINRLSKADFPKIDIQYRHPNQTSQTDVQNRSSNSKHLTIYQ